jgi:hypothetical protein
VAGDKSFLLSEIKNNEGNEFITLDNSQSLGICDHSREVDQLSHDNLSPFEFLTEGLQ